jgi:hypothetical protein
VQLTLGPDRLQEPAVVRDDDNRAPRGEQRRRQQRPRLLAAGEAVQRPVAGQVVDREPPADLVGAELVVPRARSS